MLLYSLGLAGLMAATAVQAAQNNLTWPVQIFKSSPAQPPKLNITKTGPTAPGYLFFAGEGPKAPTAAVFIMTDDGELIWQGTQGDISAYQPQTFEGKQVVALENGVSLPDPWGWAYGLIQIYDNTYNNTYNVTINGTEQHLKPFGLMNASNLQSYVDMHESKITKDGSILVTVVNTTQHDLSSVNGPKNAWVENSLFYEVDIKTNKILFRWSPLEHLDQIPFSNAIPFHPIGTDGQNSTYPWAFFHMNSVEKFQDGSYLISSRFQCSLFKIAKNGTVLWQLQGRTGGDFTLDSKLSFCYQHDARIHKETNDSLLLTIYDDENDSERDHQNFSRGTLLKLDQRSYRANLVQEFYDPKDQIYTESQGSFQLIPTSNNLSANHFLIGAGSTPKIKEFLPNGTCVLTAKFGPNKNDAIFSYRAFKHPWTGRPTAPPDVFACKNGNTSEVDVYMSWNGATENKLWSVFAGDRNETTALRNVTATPRRGFETKATIPGQARFVRVEASGKNITTGRSEVVAVKQSC